MKRATVGFLAVIAAVTGVLFGTVPANAAPGHCAAGDACVWKDHTYVTNGSGTSFVRFAQGIPNIGTWQYRNTSIWAKGNNSPISVHNQGRSQNIRIYTGLSYTGSYVQINRTYGDGNITNTAGIVTRNNFPGQLRSARFVTS